MVRMHPGSSSYVNYAKTTIVNYVVKNYYQRYKIALTSKIIRSQRVLFSHLIHLKMSNKEWTEENLLNGILQGGNERQAAIRAIYNDSGLKRMVAAFVSKNKGNEADGQDMFHEGIIVLDRNIREGKFRGEAPLKGYLYSICRFLWMNQMRKQSHTDTVAEMPISSEADTQSPEVILVTEERKAVLNSLLAELGERCQKILELWKLSYSMEEIAEKLGFSSSDMAKKAKYRCHVSLLQMIQNNPSLQQLLKH